MAVGYLFPGPQIARFGAWSVTSPQPLPPWKGNLPTVPRFAPATNTQPIDELDEPRSGQVIQAFGFGHWYERAHLFPRQIALGNLVSTQTRQIKVWNAYTTAKTLDSVLGANTTGLTLSEPGATPLQYAPLQERDYVLQISTEGAADVDASYAFAFGAEVLTLEVTGSRVIAWTFRPNWSEPVVERLQWATDVLTSYDGTEQRIRLRQYPRRTFEFAFAVDGAQRRKMETALYGWGARAWALPVWHDGQALTSTALAGAQSLTIDTTNRDYRVGGLLMLLAEDGTSEVHEIEGIAGSTVTIPGALAQTWPAGYGQVFPARLARLPESLAFSRFTYDMAYGRARFETTDASDWTPAVAATTYLGYPVMTEPPNWVEDVGVEFQRKLQTLDYGGARRYLDESGVPSILQTHRWMMSTKAELAAYRAWLYARAGRLNAVWVPTWSDDIQVAATVGAQATAIDIEDMGYASQIDAGIHRRDIRVEMNDGTIYYRRISGGEKVGIGVERIAINTAFGITYQAGDFKKISFMSLCRLDSDGAEIAYFTGEAAEAANTMRAAGHAV